MINFNKSWPCSSQLRNMYRQLLSCQLFLPDYKEVEAQNWLDSAICSGFPLKNLQMLNILETQFIYRWASILFWDSMFWDNWMFMYRMTLLVVPDFVTNKQIQKRNTHTHRAHPLTSICILLISDFLNLHKWLNSRVQTLTISTGQKWGILDLKH